MLRFYMPRNSLTLTQAVQIQNLAFRAIDSLQADVNGKPVSTETATNLCKLISSWETAVERCRILRGKPLPGSLRPEAKTRNAHSKRGQRSALPASQQNAAQPSTPDTAQSTAEPPKESL